jgi:son of sevenless-like protein
MPFVQELVAVFSADNNCSQYRQTLAAASGPCIPFLGTLLTDLTMVDSGNPDYLDARPGFLNVNKLRMTYSLLDTIVLRRQMKPYNLAPMKHVVCGRGDATTCGPMDSWADTCAPCPQITILTMPVDPVDEELAFDRSLALEPRAGAPDPAPA